MVKTLMAVLLGLLLLTLFTAGTNNCCENSISPEDNSIIWNDCCSTTDSPSDESSETENTDDLQVPDCCG